MMPDAAHIGSGEGLPPALLEPKNFAFRQGRVDAQLEKEHMAVVRLTLQGAPELIMAPFGQVSQYFKDKDGFQGQMPVACVRNQLLKMKPEAVQAMVKSVPTYKARLTKGLALYIPPHFVAIENSEEKFDLLGMQVNAIAAVNKDVAAELAAFVIASTSRGFWA